jgi:hypothetical protein
MGKGEFLLPLMPYIHIVLSAIFTLLFIYQLFYVQPVHTVNFILLHIFEPLSVAAFHHVDFS